VLVVTHDRLASAHRGRVSPFFLVSGSHGRGSRCG
jgi:hypothetical protein